MGLQVSQGFSVWEIPTMRCDVLYLCLEDTLKRIKDRLFDLTDDSTRSFHLAVTCGLIGNGLEEEIINFLEDFPKTKMVIIDTLQKVQDSRGSAGKTVRQRLRRHFLHQAVDLQMSMIFPCPPHLRKAKGRGRSVQRGLRFHRHHRGGGHQLCAQA
ncbi:MAG: hypothetical protein ACLTB5_08045 [Acutalibacteraceae bacterium]